MNVHRSGRAVAAIASVAFLLAGCSAGGAATASPSAATPAPTAIASASPVASAVAPVPSLAGVTLTLWRKEYDNAGIDAINAAFEKLTGAKITVTKIPSPGTDTVLPKWNAGERPDVLYLEGFASTMAKLNAADNLLPLDDMAFVQNIDPALKDFGLLNGVRYWAPLTAPTINGLLYNKKVVADLGLTLPTNLQELLSFCDSAKAKGTIPMAIGEKDNFPAWATVNAMTSDFLSDNPAFAGGLMDRSKKFTDPEYVKRIQSLADLKARGCYEDKAEAVDFASSMKLFMDDKAAIFNCGSFCTPDLIGASGLDAVNAKVGFLPISYTKPAVWLYGGDDWGIYLNKSGDAAQEAAAKAYVDFALGDGYELYLSAMHEPTRYANHPVPDASQLSTPTQESITAAKAGPAAAAIEPLLVCFPSYGDYFTMLNELFVGDKTAQQVAEQLQTSFDQTCKDLKQPGF